MMFCSSCKQMICILILQFSEGLKVLAWLIGAFAAKIA